MDSLKTMWNDAHIVNNLTRIEESILIQLVDEDDYDDFVENVTDDIVDFLYDNDIDFNVIELDD